MKRCSSQFPYESADDSEPCLKVESDEVTQSFIKELQEAVNAAGIKVLNVRLNDLTYAPEIAQSMLMRQQAMALIDARKTIVEGAVEIVRDAVYRLQKAELDMTHEERERLISNLLVVICSGERTQPVMQIQSAGAHGKRLPDWPEMRIRPVEQLFVEGRIGRIRPSFSFLTGIK